MRSPFLSRMVLCIASIIAYRLNDCDRHRCGLNGSVQGGVCTLTMRGGNATMGDIQRVVYLVPGARNLVSR